MNKTPAEVAAHLNNLYHASYGDKVRGRFVLSSAALRRLAGRARLEGGLIAKIAQVLTNEYGLILIHANDIYAIEQEAALKKWREVPKGLLSKESRRKAVSGNNKEHKSVVTTVINPANAWPFPTNIRR